MSWLRSHLAAFASRDAARHHSSSGQSPSTSKLDVADLSEYDSSAKYFELFWHDAEAILNKPLPTSEKPSVRALASIDDCEIVIHFTDKMVKLLTDGSSSIGCDPQLLDYFYTEDVLGRLRTFGRQRLEYRSRIVAHQLGIYDTLMSHSQHQLLMQKQFTEPLLNLLDDCKQEQTKDEIVEEKLLAVLHQICIAVTQNVHLLDLLIEPSASDVNCKFFDFSMLLPYVHRIGIIGQQARDDLLLLMSLSGNHEAISKYVTEKTDFCQVLVVSLSGLYSLLPRTLTYGSDDWHCITDEDIAGNTDLQMFLNLLEFCSALVQVSHSVVQNQLLSFIYSGFLVSVIGPTLHQFDSMTMSKNLNSEFGESLLLLLVQSGLEEAIAVTAYFDLWLRRIAEPHLLKIFLKFILLGKMEDVTILDSLVQRINSSNMRLCIVTLALFRTLVDLNCEDIMYQLVFRYLVPCTHIMVSQQRSVSDIDMYCKAAEKLISMIPASCRIESRTGSRYSTDEIDARIAPPNRNGENVSPSQTSDGSLTSDSTSSRDAHRSESSYLDYLLLARARVRDCMESCKSWTSSYGASEHQVSVVTSLTSSASSDPLTLDFTSSGTAGGSDATGLCSANLSETDSLICDEVSELNSHAVTRSGDDLVSFLVKLNRISLPDGSEISENVVSEFELVLEDVLKDHVVSSASSPRRPEESGDAVCLKYESLNVYTGSDSQSCASDSQGHDAIAVETNGVSRPMDLCPIDSKHSMLAKSGRGFMANGGMPTVGPFLTAVLNKLEAMKQNTLYVNLQLTGLIAKLACYPQPLLSSLLLSHSLIFQPSVKSLFQVLNTVKCRLEEFLYHLKDKDQLLEQAYNFLHWRDSCQEQKNSADKNAVPSRRHSLMAVNSPKPAVETKISLKLKLLDKRGVYFNNRQQKQLPSDVKETQEVVEKKNAIYCAVVFKEFIKELAAISQEHALLLVKDSYVTSSDAR